MIERLKILLIVIAMIGSTFTVPLIASDDSSVEGSDDNAGDDDTDGADDAASAASDGDDDDLAELGEAIVDSLTGDNDDEEENDDDAANDTEDVASASSGEDKDNPFEELGEKIVEDLTGGGLTALEDLAAGDAEGAEAALVQTGLDVEEDVLDTTEAAVTGKSTTSGSAVSRRREAEAGLEEVATKREVDSDDEDEGSSKAATSSRQAFLGGLDGGQYGKALSDYVTDYPYLLRHTAHACLYAYPDERGSGVKESLEEDGWEIQNETSHWVCMQNGGLNVLAFKGTVAGEEDGFLKQVFLVDGYKNYAKGSALSISVKQGYADFFDRIDGVGVVSSLVRDADDDETFIFTGHSKGGAFAQISGIAALGTSAQARSSVIAYGVMPIFSADGASVVNDLRHAFLRVSKEGDGVVEAVGGAKGYHGGALYQLGFDKRSVVEEALDEDAPVTGGLRYTLSHHYMRGYLETVHGHNLEDCLH